MNIDISLKSFWLAAFITYMGLNAVLWIALGQRRSRTFWTCWNGLMVIICLGWWLSS